MKRILTLVLCSVTFSTQAQVLLTGRAQSFHYTYEDVQAAADDAAMREYVEFVTDGKLSGNEQLQARLDALLKP